MTSLWRYTSESHFTAGAACRSKKAVRPAKAIESGNHSCRNTAHSSRRSKKGFTLIELIVVMLIMAILVGIVIISIGGVIGRSQETAYDGEDESIRIAVAAYYVANMEWPTLDALNGGPGILDLEKLTASTETQLPYLDEIPATASDLNCPSADVECTGHYTWTVDASARVTSICTPVGECDGTGDGYQGVYP